MVQVVRHILALLQEQIRVLKYLVNLLDRQLLFSFQKIRLIQQLRLLDRRSLSHMNREIFLKIRSSQWFRLLDRWSLSCMKKEVFLKIRQIEPVVQVVRHVLALLQKQIKSIKRSGRASGSGCDTYSLSCKSREMFLNSFFCRNQEMSQ